MKFAEERQAWVKEALSWIPTPFLTGQRVKHAGADCGTFIIGVAIARGFLVDSNVGVYSGDWWMHTESEWYLFRTIRHAKKLVESYARSGKLEAEPGDIVLTRAGSSPVYNHGGIVISWPRIVQCYGQGVHVVNAMRDPIWCDHEVAVFDPFQKRYEDEQRAKAADCAAASVAAHD